MLKRESELSSDTLIDKPFLLELWNAELLQIAAYGCESYRLLVFKIM